MEVKMGIIGKKDSEGAKGAEGADDWVKWVKWGKEGAIPKPVGGVLSAGRIGKRIG